MKFNLNTEQFNLILKENGVSEAQRVLKPADKKAVYDAGQELASDVYGDKFDKENKKMGEYYSIPNYKDDADIKGGLFSVGNAKLSPDTLIINFTSAFACPSATQCPVSQAACYAVAGENRLKDTRSKNVKVHNLVTRCVNQDKLGQFFQIAKLYIELLKNDKTPIRWVRFNEAGDFPNQKVVDMATQFAKEIEAEYGVKCMAYTANGNLDYTEAAKVIAINASTNKVLDKMGPNAMRRNFFAAPHQVVNYDFISDKYDAEYEEYKIKHNLKSSHKADEVSINVAEKLNVNGTADDITVPILEYGKWGNAEDESGYYYVCPCSFWKDRKDQIEIPYCEKYLDTPPYNIKHLRKVYPKTINAKGREVDHPIVKALVKELNKIKSPCGISCAVCHDRRGGIIKGTNKHVKDYAIITAVHGSTGKKFSPLYAHSKRVGDPDAKYTDENPNGLWRNPSGIGKYGTPPTPPVNK